MADARKLDTIEEDEETALLGAVVRNGQKGFDAAVAAGLQARHFGLKQRAEVWETIDALVKAGVAPASVAIGKALQRRLGAEGARFWHHLVSEYPFTTPEDASFFAKRVIVHALRRTAGTELMAVARDISEPEADVIGKVQKLSNDLLDLTSASAADFVSMGEAQGRAVSAVDRAQHGEQIGVPTGFADLDGVLGSLQPGYLYVLGARPSMGKSALGAWIAFNAARANAVVPFFSLEMTAQQIALRLACGLGSVNLSNTLKADRLSTEEQSRLVGRLNELRSLPIPITERLGITPAEMIGLARPIVRSAERKLIIVDHLGIVGVPDDIEALGLTQRTAFVSKSLKRMAKELDAPVLALAQLSRANEQRDDKRPQLSDLRWAGEIEQDADCVMFLHRESYYLDRTPPRRRPDESEEAFLMRRSRHQDAAEAAHGRAEIVIAKHRDGPLDTITLHFDATTTRFSNLKDGDLDE